jgi:hypothetical protein
MLGLIPFSKSGFGSRIMGLGSGDGFGRGFGRGFSGLFFAMIMFC